MKKLKQNIYFAFFSEYSTAVQDQLFEELQAQADEDGISMYPLKDVMDSFTTQSGFPIISLKWSSGNTVLISQVCFFTNLWYKFIMQDLNKLFFPHPQEKFLLNATLKQADDDGRWYIPVSYATKSNPDFSESSWKPKLWMNKNDIVITTNIGGVGAGDWVMLNPDTRSN